MSTSLLSVRSRSLVILWIWIMVWGANGPTWIIHTPISDSITVTINSFVSFFLLLQSGCWWILNQCYTQIKWRTRLRLKMTSNGSVTNMKAMQSGVSGDGPFLLIVKRLHKIQIGCCVWRTASSTWSVMAVDIQIKWWFN